METESYAIFLKFINEQFREFRKKILKKKEIEYNITKIHRIKPEEFEQEGYFMIICTQETYCDIDERSIEIWKVYKTEKYYHVLEFSQPLSNFFRGKSNCNYDFNIYNYYDYNRHDLSEEYLWRNSTEILGIKLPDTFKL